jgi:ATP-binding cassette, subfamily B, bacterial
MTTRFQRAPRETMSRRTPTGDVRLLRRLLAEARPDWARIGSVYVLGLLATPLALLMPVPLKIAVDSVLGDHPLPGFVDAVLPAAATRTDAALLAVTAGLVVLVTILSQMQDLASSVLRASVGERLLLRFRSRLFDRAQQLSLQHHDRVGTADTTYRIEFDARALQYVALESSVSLVTAGTTLVAMFVVMTLIDPALALVALAISPVLVLSSRWFRSRLRARSRSVKKLESGALSVVQEVLTSIRVVKAFGQEPREHDRFLRRSSDGMHARIGLAYEEGAYSATVGTTMAVGSAAVLLVGVQHVQSGILTLGELLLVMSYLTQFYAPLKTMARKAGKLQSHLASAERAFALLDQPPEVPEPAEGRPLVRAAGAIEFSSVRFAYDGGPPVLRDVSFRLEPGSRVGIAGRTGAGKTTMIGLLARFYDPDEGRITLDGVDLRDYRLADLRRQFGVVLQEPVLFACSVAENIAYADPAATHAEVVHAATLANAHAFITRLPEGYETQVGERGMRLSGGERQRIALARAFLTDAPILILDEPTSSVDVETEASIMEALERLMAGRTTLLIAHRLGTLDRCDLVLRVEGGRIVPTGRPPVARGPGPTSTSLRQTARPASVHATSTHPAVRAWRRIEPHAQPERVEVLKERSRGLRKSAVYRLVGRDGWSVIAKCSRRDTATVENIVYRDLLPRLDLPSLRWYGEVDDGGRYTWFFIADAIGDAYRTDVEHRAIAGHWLGQLHAGALTLPASAELPDRGPTAFLRHLHDTRARLETALGWALPDGQARLIRGTAGTLEAVEAGWGAVTEACGSMSRTLVHGDLVPKNLQVIGPPGSSHAVVYDWEKAGYGPPAVDLARVDGYPRFAASVDLETYRRAAADRGVEVAVDTLARASSAGTVLRCLASLDWATMGLAPGWVDAPMADLAFYRPWLERAMRDLAGPTPAGRGRAGTVRQPPDDAASSALHDLVVASLPDDAAARRRVTAIDRMPSDRSSSYPTEIVTVRFADGGDARLFLKDLSTRRYDEADVAERRSREIAVYRELLAGSELGTPRYLGSVEDAAANRFWLLLELVDGTPVKRARFDAWVLAAAWLGRLHAHAASHPDLLTRCRSVQPLTADLFLATAGAAVEAAAAYGPDLARRVTHALVDYPDIAAAMAAAPRTLVHGGYRPQNILLRADGEPRICPIDWEEAAAGPAAYDLAYLCDGFDDRRRGILVEAYRDEATCRGLQVPGEVEIRTLLDACNLHKNLGTLRKAVDRDFPPESVRKLVGMVETAAARVAGAGMAAPVVPAEAAP